MKKIAINEEFLQQVETLQTVLRQNVAGMFGGNRKSKSFGSSPEFADYRDYEPGDDVSRIDWNAYARFDKLYLKLYLDERQMHTRIYIDASRSMDYGAQKKAEQAVKIAACLAYLSVAEMEKVSIYTVRDNIVSEVVPPIVGKDAYYASIGRLNDIEFDGESRLTDAILPSPVGYGDGMSVIISDFLTDSDYETAIDHLAGKKRDVLCVQILSKEEMNPQIRGKSHLFDAENAEKSYKKNIDRDIAAAYRRALEYVIARIRDFCHARGASYLLAPAEDAIGDIFFTRLADKGVVK